MDFFIIQRMRKSREEVGAHDAETLGPSLVEMVCITQQGQKMASN